MNRYFRNCISESFTFQADDPEPLFVKIEDLDTLHLKFFYFQKSPIWIRTRCRNIPDPNPEKICGY